MMDLLHYLTLLKLKCFLLDYWSIIEQFVTPFYGATMNHDRFFYIDSYTFQTMTVFLTKMALWQAMETYVFDFLNDAN